MSREIRTVTAALVLAIATACRGAKADQLVAAPADSAAEMRSQATAVPAPVGTALVRLVNAVPDENAIDLHGGVHTFFADLEYQTASSYVEVETDITAFELVRHVSGARLASEHWALAAGERYTVIAMADEGGGVRLQIFRDDLKPSPGLARLRVINASPGGAHVEVSIVGRRRPHFEDVSYGAIPAWQDLVPTTGTVEISSDVAGSLPVVIRNMQFSAGKAYMIVLAGSPGSTLQAIAFSDIVIDRAPVRTAQARP